MAKRGRPTIFDETKRTEFCTMISVGVSRTTAARLVGCSFTTIRHAATHDPDFRERLRKAEQMAVIEPLSQIRRAGLNSWRAAAWHLERTRPDEFARQDPKLMQPAVFEDTVKELAEIVVEEVSDPGARQRIQSRLRRELETKKREALAVHDPLFSADNMAVSGEQ